MGSVLHCVADLVAASGGGLILDGMRLRKVILDNVYISYSGGPQMQEVYFFDCSFSIRQEPNGQALLTAALKPTPATSFNKDFAQDPENGLGRWEHLHDSVWSIPNAYPRVITSYYSNAHTVKHAFRCANTVLQLGGERLMNIDCIETRDGWRFDYEGMQDDASEAMSILQKSM